MDDPVQGLVHGRLSHVVPARGEAFHALATVAGVRVEHIVSSAAPDPAPQVQDWDEWVLVLEGAAELDLSGRVRVLVAGDWIVIPAGVEHGVVAAEPGTHWIAVHGPAPGTADPRQEPPGPAGVQGEGRDAPG